MESDISKQQVTPNQISPQEQIPNPPISNQKGFIPLILGAVILLIIVASGAYYLGTKNTSTNPKTDTTEVPTAVATTTPQTPSATQPPISSEQNTNISLTVTKLQTSFGIDGMPTPSYPNSVVISVPKSVGDQLAAYGAGGYVIIAPKGWTGQGQVGADGNTSITLYPSSGFSENGSKLTVFIASTGTGSALWDAAPFNSWVRDHWQELGMPPPAPTPPPGIVATQITSHIIRYSLPVNNGFETNGVSYSNAQDHQKDSMWAFEKLEVVLPTNQKSLATAITDAFIQNRNLANK